MGHRLAERMGGARSEDQSRLERSGDVPKRDPARPVTTLSGVFIGALYGLLGLGLSLSWGMLRQINLAHFALAFLGAYLTYQLVEVYGVDPLLSLLVIVPIFFLL